MRITPFYILVLMFLFSFHFGYSQNNFSGIVLDYNNNPLPGADIQILGTNQFTYTDLEGKFSVLVKQEQFDILVSYIGFEDKKLSIDMIKSPYIEIVLDNTLFLNEIVVNANLEGQSKALNVQRNKINMSNIVSEEQFSRFPDANMGDALKRLPGINVQYDQGEARFANIRGTSPELNSITLNGERVPSAEAEKRFVQLDLIPSDMVETIEVNKAVTPDMDADAIGGSINLVTKNAGKNPELNINLGSGYSFLTEKPIFKTKIQAEKRFFENKLGIILDASLLNRFTRSDDIEAEWNYSDENNKNSTAFTEDFQIRQYAVQRFRQSYSGQFDYNINQNHNLKLGGMYTKREDWENRYRYRIKDIEEDGNAYVGTIERETKGGSTSNKGARLEDQQTYSLNLGGEHKLNRLNIDWSIAKLHAQEDRPHERYINYRLKNIELKTD
ncbi:MAG: TonB-dependent receptor plug domain-containing protein, partial [Saprospiraceae bacterium]|nr:TonB-dependent receptor plug domain-containing protein [Saprospiraceae bacterium]